MLNRLSDVELGAILEGVLRGSDWTPFYREKIREVFAQAASTPAPEGGEIIDQLIAKADQQAEQLKGSIGQAQWHLFALWLDENRPQPQGDEEGKA